MIMRLRARARPNLFPQTRYESYVWFKKGVKNCSVGCSFGKMEYTLGTWGEKNKFRLDLGAPARVQIMYYRYLSSERASDRREGK